MPRVGFEVKMQVFDRAAKQDSLLRQISTNVNELHLKKLKLRNIHIIYEPG
jgi:hypothetical protein